MSGATPIGSEGSRRMAGGHSTSFLEPNVRPEIDSSEMRSAQELAEIAAGWLMDPAVEAELEVLKERASEARPTSVYRLFDAEGQLLYVGITNHGYHRLHQHAASKDWWADVATARFEHCPDRRTAQVKEALAIRDEKPAYNIAAPVPDRPQLPGKRKAGTERPVKGIRTHGRLATTMDQDQAWETLERQAKRWFGLTASELIREWESGTIAKGDHRLGLCVSMMALVDVSIAEFGA